MFLLLIIIEFVSITNADYVKVVQYETSSTCSGSIYSTQAKLGDLGFSDGCVAFSAGIYQKYICANSTSILSNKYYSSTCSGNPFESQAVTSVQFGCETVSASSSYNTMCISGTFSMSSFSYVQTSYSSSIPCSAVSFATPTSIIEAPLDTCIPYSSNGLKYTFDSGSGNISQFLFSTPDCSISNGNPTIISTVGCVSTLSDTLVTLSTGAISPSPTPTSSASPSPSISPSALPTIQQTYLRLLSYYGDTTCSTSPNPSYTIDNIQSCLSSPSSGKSFLRICSSDGRTFIQYTFPNLICSGQPISSMNSTLGCVATTGSGSYQYTCFTGDYNPPSNALVIKSFKNTQTCAESGVLKIFTSVANIYYTIYPIDMCLTTNTGSSFVTCSSSLASIRQFDTNSLCDGTPDVVTTAPIGSCNLSSVNVANSFIAECPGLASPSPISTVTPTPSPSLSRGASPSTTPSFKATSTPLNPTLSKYVLATNGGLTASRVKRSTTTEDDCIIDAKFEPIMSILVYNPLNGIVNIKQKGMKRDFTTYDVNLTINVNTISSTALWIRLGNISCISNDNPTGYCVLSYRGTQNITVWTSYYKLSTEISARNASGGEGSLGGGIVGGLILVLLVLAVLHSLRIINIPCFNSCCDNRAKRKNLTSYPIAIPVIQQPQQQPRAQVVAMMQPQILQSQGNYPSYPIQPIQPQPYPVYPPPPPSLSSSSSSSSSSFSRSTGV
jgi:hypothetical protein